jgi:DNA-binding GntR family transcriptional regulator
VSTLIAELSDHSERYRLRFGDPGSWPERRAEHREILDAAAAGDADLAARRLALHYARTAALVFAVLDPEHDPERLRTAIRSVAPGAEAAFTGSRATLEG